MMRKITILFISLVFIFFISGCIDSNIMVPIPESENEEENSIHIDSFLMVKGNPEKVIDCTPELVVFTEKKNVKKMSFSGDGKNWTDWVTYCETYNDFNIASGLYGASMESGLKTIDVRFKDIDDNVFPTKSQKSVCCQVEYEMQPLFSLKIEPEKIQLCIGESQIFMVRGFDHFGKNEIPLDGQKVQWEKTCGTGTLNPVSGLKTVYTAPKILGTRDISAHYGKLGTGAWVEVIDLSDSKEDINE